jgi:hypothetical protein
MRQLRVWISMLAALLALSACGAFQSAPVKPVQLTTSGMPSAFPMAGFTTATLLPADAYVLATTRPSPQPGGPPVFCAEPGPDWAAAFGNSYKGGASGGDGGVTAALNGELDSTETNIALSGRTAGVVALRDGLYSACQAYANGIIGKDAYALILSQYGNLLVALASGGTATPDAAELQQQAVQAMLVACITHDDPSGGPPPVNPMLDFYCAPFMADFIKSVPALLKPIAPLPPAKPAPAPAPPAKTPASA